MGQTAQAAQAAQTTREDRDMSTLTALVIRAASETAEASAAQAALRSAHQTSDDPTALHQTTVTVRSGNAKIGRIPATSRPQTTCPPDCPFMGSGCYGENRPGRPSCFDMVERAIANGTNVATLATVRAHHYRTGPRAARFNVVGDFLCGPDHRPDMPYIAETNRTADDLRARYGTVAWSYTHAWSGYGLSPDLFSYVVRASCQSAEEVRAAHAAGWAACVVDPGSDSPDTLIGSTIDGRTVVQCPVTTGARPDCESCRLCGRDAAVVAFPVHGSARKRAASAVRSRRSAEAR